MKNPELFKADVSMITDSKCIFAVKCVPVPKCLTERPLMVGDPEQCRELKQYEKIINNIITEYEEENNDEEKEYVVEVTYSFSGSITVKAKNKFEAEEKGIDKLGWKSIDLDECDVERVNVYRED